MLSLCLPERLVAPASRRCLIGLQDEFMRPSWNEYFMLIAKLVSTRSTCNSRLTGAVLVKDKQILTGAAIDR